MVTWTVSEILTGSKKKPSASLTGSLRTSQILSGYSSRYCRCISDSISHVYAKNINCAIFNEVTFRNQFDFPTNKFTKRSSLLRGIGSLLAIILYYRVLAYTGNTLCVLEGMCLSLTRDDLYWTLRETSLVRTDHRVIQHN